MGQVGCQRVAKNEKMVTNVAYAKGGYATTCFLEGFGSSKEELPK